MTGDAAGMAVQTAEPAFLMSDLLRIHKPPGCGVASQFSTSTYFNTPSAEKLACALPPNGLWLLATIFMRNAG